MAKYTINNKEVTKEEFEERMTNGFQGKIIIEEPFFLDEIIYTENSSLAHNISQALSKGAYDFKLPVAGSIHHTGGTVFEKVQNSTIDPLDAYNAITGHSTRHKSQGVKQEDLGKGINNRPNPIKDCQPVPKIGKKESKTVEKAPIFTYCKQMKNAIEALSLRSLYGHKQYEKGDDWENFSRVENGDFEYSNAEFRHALGIGEDSYEDHLVAAAWNAVSRLEIHLRNKK